MKAKVEIQKKEFKPFDLTITVESQRELELLWAFFNASNNRKESFLNETIRCGANTHEIQPFAVVECQMYSVWNVIDEKLKEFSK